MELQNNFKFLKEKIEELYKKNKESNKRIIIAISGIPGSGKSSFAKFLLNFLQENYEQNFQSIIIPLDGFHKYKRELNEDQMKFRGRIDTFDLKNFKNKLSELISSDNLDDMFFPSFKHEIKDPKENEIKINKNHKIIILEGLYLFSNELNIDNFFDIKVFIESNLKEAMNRVAIRNFEAGISKTIEDSYKRVDYNDKLNAEYFLENSNFENTVIFKFIN